MSFVATGDENDFTGPLRVAVKKREWVELIYVPPCKKLPLPPSLALYASVLHLSAFRFCAQDVCIG